MLLPHTLYVITGASRGFGQAIANAIASKANHKSTLILVGRQRDPLENVANQLQGNASVTARVISDVSLDSAVAAQRTILKPLETMVTELQQPVTRAVLVNNAGSTGDLSKKVSGYEAQEVQAYVDMNIASYITLVSGFIRLFHPEEEDDNSAAAAVTAATRPIAPELTIVNISSLLAVQPFANWGLYASGKAARDMLLRIVAKEEVCFESNLQPDPDTINYKKMLHISMQESVRTLSYAPGPLDNEMQQHVRETLGDAEQKKLYTDMAYEVTK
ncbi:hypothetical protein BDB00DRAFT_755268 [Zychaea mexicana]|uniref:uncharacterized protein n=1 Tax=Zychaea mexicana TaxID=64656 RepID=UPI0022FDC7D1|nr:uncharacterized protein BDB00DRAFT_755268 [Zychaea mexicana]KAI9498062.1 hypothetical protein BDB00DRAFT_755268 [Zychaea mexicana]